jgi:peroxiredoxin
VVATNRARALVLAAAIAISAVGAVIWSRVVTGEASAPDAVLDEPGEYVEPGGPTNPPLPTDQLPDVSLTAADGTDVALVPDGRPMVVNLWFSTCPPCAKELADFAAVHDELGDSVRFVGVNPLDSVAAMTRFAGDRGVTYELLRDRTEALATALDVSAYPVTLFVGADGSILDSTGPIDAAGLRARIAELWS